MSYVCPHLITSHFQPLKAVIWSAISVGLVYMEVEACALLATAAGWAQIGNDPLLDVLNITFISNIMRKHLYCLLLCLR